MAAIFGEATAVVPGAGGVTNPIAYYVNNSSVNHFGDPQWFTLSSGIRVGYNGVNSSIQQVSVTPINLWQIAPTSAPFREWLVVSIGAVPTACSLDFHNDLYATRVGVFQLGDVTTGTTAGDAAALAVLNIDPLFTVASGEGFTLTTGTYHLSPQGGTAVDHSVEGNGVIYWLGDDANEFDIPGHDAWILTQEFMYDTGNETLAVVGIHERPFSTGWVAG